MKCKHCGGEQFVGHQVVRMDVLVDENGNYIDAVTPDAPGNDIYDSEAAYGPFQCCGCGAEYDKLVEGEDFIDGPIEGWIWEEKMEEVNGCSACNGGFEDDTAKFATAYLAETAKVSIRLVDGDIIYTGEIGEAPFHMLKHTKFMSLDGLGEENDIRLCVAATPEYWEWSKKCHELGC